MDSGWIKIHRKILDWEWYSDINTCRLFFHLLLKVNHEDSTWRGVTIKRGQTLTSLPSLAAETKLSPRMLRCSLNKLKTTGEVSNHSTNLYRLITINKYDEYQDKDRQSGRRRADGGQANDRQSGTKQEEKNDKNEKNEKKGESTQPDFEKLSHDLKVSVRTVERYYQKITDYEASSGKKYRDYAATVRSWVRKDIDDGKLKISEERVIPDSEKQILKNLERIKNYV
jgi:hypothetical protein